MQKSKLVRDYVIGIMKENGEKPDFYIADEDEYKERLQEKLLEEVNEYLRSGEKEELADILEVIYAIAEQKKMGLKELDELRERKRASSGAFKEKIILKK
jgi:predicted house-cleaning noncanonical NTP pyrophosphatase (MazG superfamily)